MGKSNKSFEEMGFGRNWRNMLPGRGPEAHRSEVLSERELLRRRVSNVYENTSLNIPLTYLHLLTPRNGAKSVTIPLEEGGSVQLELIDVVQGQVLINRPRFTREKLLQALHNLQRGW